MVIYILTKFGADWLIFVDARVLRRKLWTDGQIDGHGRTKKDHNSSMSTPCSGELKMRVSSISHHYPFPHGCAVNSNFTSGVPKSKMDIFSKLRIQKLLQYQGCCAGKLFSYVDSTSV